MSNVIDHAKSLLVGLFVIAAFVAPFALAAFVGYMIGGGGGAGAGVAVLICVTFLGSCAWSLGDTLRDGRLP